MPAHQLTATTERADSSGTLGIQRIERAVLEVLAGLPFDEAAARTNTETTDLAAAVDLYRRAGCRALQDQADAGNWWHLYLHMTNWPDAEHIAAAHLAPLLNRAQDDGLITAWWFIRKHPCWRLRLHLTSEATKTLLAEELNAFLVDGHLERWWPGLYEAETAAFGGTTGMTAAHALFCADSQAILGLQQRQNLPLQRRELSVLLCTVLMRAAGLEWYEQGDVWHRVTLERPLPEDVPPERVRTMTPPLRQLLLTNLDPDGPLLGHDGPLAAVAAWTDAFRSLGQTLGIAARDGVLERGLRAVITYHVIFHWNRLGLSGRTQSLLASAARTAILDPADAD